MKSKAVTVNDKMQRNYRYKLHGAFGAQFRFRIQAAAHAQGNARTGCVRRQVHDGLRQGISRRAGSHAPSCRPKKQDPGLNYFGIDASKPLSYWKKKGWIWKDDPRGWFQWYCRYYMGRRSEDDARQIKRWKQIKRHIAQLQKHCEPGDPHCRPRQRQALLHWAYDSRKL